MTTKTFTLDHFGGNRFALVDVDNQDVITDYFPGIWGIETQKKAIQYTRELIAEGKTVVAGTGDEQKISRILKNV